MIGSLHLKQALGAGQVTYEPGLLAAAHRGILYVDEVNLLHDHLVDLLLDAAAMGRSTVERDGVSVSHAARFVLVGTMNPEEGELRPQLLDRFGLTVEVAAPRDPALRAEVVRRRMAYDADPGRLRRRVRRRPRRSCGRGSSTARSDRCRWSRLTDRAADQIAEVCAAFEVDGMRADIVTARAAVAHAAWHGRTEVITADIRAAARLALPHRRRRNPFDAPGLDEDLLDQLLDDDEPEPDPTAEPPDRTRALSRLDAPGRDEGRFDRLRARRADARRARRAARRQAQGSGRCARRPPTGPGCFTAAGVGARRGRAAEPGASPRPGARSARRPPVPSPARCTCRPPSGPRRRTSGAAAGRHGDRLRLRRDDLRLAVTEGRESNLVLFCVDASGSMAARRRMEAVKAAALSLLLDAYQRRDKVGLITFRGADATLALPPTSSVDIAARRLRELPAGGRTPLAEGLLCAAETLRLERDPRPAPPAAAGVVTDGRATSGPDAVARSRQAAELLAADRGRRRGDRLRDRPVPARPGRGAGRASRRPSTCRSARSRADRC